MNAEAALNRQIEAYRQMSGQRRLEIALELHDLACHLSRVGIKLRHPDADDEEVERQLRAILQMAQQP